MTVDLLGKVLTEVRDWPAVAAITTRVRGGEFAPGDAPPCVVIRKLANDLAPFGRGYRAGLQRPLFSVQAYGNSYLQAGQLAAAITDAIHLRGPRKASGRYIALSLVESGGDQSKDPDTNWPVETLVVSAVGALEAVA